MLHVGLNNFIMVVTQPHADLASWGRTATIKLLSSQTSLRVSHQAMHQHTRTAKYAACRNSLTSDDDVIKSEVLYI